MDMDLETLKQLGVTGAALLIAWAELRVLRPQRMAHAWLRAIGARVGVTAAELADAGRSPHPIETEALKHGPTK